MSANSLQDDLANSMTLAQTIVASLIFPVNQILTIENHMFCGTFLHVTFGSQSLLKPTSDQTGSDTNWMTGQGDKGVNESQLKFLEGTWLMPQNRPNAHLF
jgi:hypothetical protein